MQLQGHRCQSIISLIFHSLSLSLQPHTSHAARCVTLRVCVLTQVISGLLWTPAPCALWASFSLTFSPCFVTDRPYFCHPERLRHSGVKGCWLPPSLFLHPSSPAPLLICLRPSPSAVCVCLCVCTVSECVNAFLLQLPAFHWNVI